MAKKSSNPADAYRKALRAKELKKNKDERKKKRDDKTAKRDTRELEAEIREIKSGKMNDAAKERLATLESELSYVTKLKEKFVTAHPDQRDKVYRTDRAGGAGNRGGHGGDDGDEDGGGSFGDSARDPTAHLYNPDGTLRDPKRSAYYDPIYNPFGAPPPGMPYRARTDYESESEEDSDSDDDDDDDDSDDDIVMPTGPRPEPLDSDSDDSDDIPLPAGPPPGTIPPSTAYTPIPPPVPIPVQPWTAEPWTAEPWTADPWNTPAAPFPNARPPSHAQPHVRPPVGVRPPPPPRPFVAARPLPAGPSSLPARPGSAVASAPPSGLAPKGATTGGTISASATISAEPQLRDLRKESTVFVPRGVTKRKPGGGRVVNSAPHAGHVDEDGDEVRVKPASGPGLLGKLQGVLGGGQQIPPRPGAAEAEGEDEYARFLEGL